MSLLLTLAGAVLGVAVICAHRRPRRARRRLAGRAPAARARRSSRRTEPAALRRTAPSGAVHRTRGLRANPAVPRSRPDVGSAHVHLPPPRSRLQPASCGSRGCRAEGPRWPSSCSPTSSTRGARYFTIGDLGDATDQRPLDRRPRGQPARRHRGRRPDRADRLDRPVDAQPRLPRRPARRRSPARCGSCTARPAPPTPACATRCSPPGCSRSRSTACSPSPRRGSPDIGLVDTISSQTGFAMDSSLTTLLLQRARRGPEPARRLRVRGRHRGRLRHLQPRAEGRSRHLWGPIVALAVVATGNHYVFDIVAGMVAAAIGYGLGALVAKGTEKVF